MSKPSLCFTCFYSLRNVCPHCQNKHKVIKGSIISEGYVIQCPKYFPDQLSVNQIARLVGCSPSAVSKNWSRVLQKLEAQGWVVQRLFDSDADRPKADYVVRKFPKDAIINQPQHCD